MWELKRSMFFLIPGVEFYEYKNKVIFRDVDDKNWKLTVSIDMINIDNNSDEFYHLNPKKIMKLKNKNVLEND